MKLTVTLFLCLLRPASGCNYVHWERPGGGSLNQYCDGDYYKSTEICNGKPAYKSSNTPQRYLIYSQSNEWICSGLACSQDIYEKLDGQSETPVGLTANISGTCRDGIHQGVPNNSTVDDSLYRMVDGHYNTCHVFSGPKPEVMVLDDDSTKSKVVVFVQIHGENVYCNVFDESCSTLALQLFTRSFKDSNIQGDEKCHPLCGNEVSCLPMWNYKNKCGLKCICPEGGCNEFVLIMNEGMLTFGKTTKICEVFIKP